MSATEPPNEAELRAAYEAQMKQIRVEDLLLETVVSMINFGMRRTGLVAGTESERDAHQVQLAIESVRALMPLVEPIAPDQVSQIRQALSQLQLAFVRIGGAAGPGDQPLAGAGATAAGAPASGMATSPSGAATPPPGAATPARGGTAPAPGRAAPGPGPAGGDGGQAPGGPGGGDPGPADSDQAPIKPGEPGPAQRSGRLWVPGSR